MTDDAGAASTRAPKTAAPKTGAPKTNGAPPMGVRAAASRRDTAIDVLRGLCIVSMTTAHVAAGTVPYRVAHAAVFVDGAVGFVLLSGVMVGRVQRRAIDAQGRSAGVRKLLRRVGLIYLAHVALCVVGMLVVAADPARGDMYAGVSALGGPVPAALATLGLQVNPYYTSILSLYVLLLLLAIPAVLAVSFRAPAPVAAASLALYVAGLLWPEPFTFAERPGVPSPVNWATWQLLFMAAVLVGWYWRGPVLRKAVRSRGMVYAAVAFVLACAALGWAATTGAPAAWKTVTAAAFSDGALGPGRLLMAFAAVLVGYRICLWVLPRTGPLFTPIALIGRHALDCYIVLSLTVILLPGGLAYDTTGWIGVAVTVDVLVLMVLWCAARERGSTSLRSLQQLPRRIIGR